GFNVYRRVLDGAEWARVNPTLIAGRVTNPEAKTYSFFDLPGAGVYEYKLESISVAGHAESYSEFAGPVTVDPLNAASISADGIDVVAGSIDALSRAALARSISAKFAEMAEQNVAFDTQKSIPTHASAVEPTRNQKPETRNLKPARSLSVRWFSAA